MPEYDYSSPGAYFVTICTRDRQCLLGRQSADGVDLNAVGHVVAAAWNAGTDDFPSVRSDAFVVMPNHVHGLLWLEPVAEECGTVRIPVLGQVIRRLKSVSAQEANRLTGRRGSWLWQRGYFERVIRNERELEAARRYIVENPFRVEDGDEGIDPLILSP